VPLLDGDELKAFVAAKADPALVPGGVQVVPVDPTPALRWELVGRPRAGRRLGLDVVVHLSERVSPFGPPQVVYVYEHPKHRARRNREVGAPVRQRLVDAVTLAFFPVSMRLAAAVLCASESTRRDVGRGEVVYSGVSEAFSPDERPRTYLLHLASSDPRENSAVVLDAIGMLDAPPPLVVGGDAPVELRTRAAELGLAVEWRGFVSGAALVDLYRGAIAYVDPSLYEGFGLQAAEALGCGTPVICSNVTSLPEVVGDAGLLLEPHDVAGFAGAIRSVVEDESLRRELSRRALERAAAFSWANTARRVLEVAREAASR
jgi:glycosyltransferase involved in cell wall biosynthesis